MDRLDRRIHRWRASPLLLLLLALAAAMSGAGCRRQPAEAAGIDVRPFGQVGSQTAQLYTLRSASLTVGITNYGGRIVSLTAPDRSGQRADVTLGFDQLPPYLDKNPYFGALIGRYANRIAGASFVLDGQRYTLPRNDDANSLHGGQGFDQRLWAARIDGETLQLDLVSADGDQGYPGRLDASVRYTLRGARLRIDYRATSDRPTVVNLTHHGYYNLAGHASGDVLQHQLRLNASAYTPIDQSLIPTGEIRPVQGTPFDFREATTIGSRIGTDDPQLKRAGGYDHNWVLDGDRREPALAAWARDPSSGRSLTVLTTEPGIQFYSGNFLDGSLLGKGSVAYAHRQGFCLETQHFPDSPNQPAFPSTRLEPGRAWTSTTILAFGVE